MARHARSGAAHARVGGPLNPEGSKFLKGLYAVLIFLAFVITVIVICASLAPIPE